MQRDIIDKSVDIVPLQISTNTWDRLTDDFEKDHFHRGRLVSEKLSKPPVGDVLPQKLFQKAMESAKSSAALKKFDFEEANQHYLNRVGNIAGIPGELGMGKTTLTKQLLQKVLDQQEQWYDAKFVFYLQFRRLNYEKETSFLHFLTSGLIPSKFTNNKQR